MPRLKLTERAVARIEAPQPSGKQAVFWDQDLKGFGVLASGKTNTKAYIAQRDMPTGITRRVTISNVLELTLSEARQQASELLLEMRRGIDPKAGRRGAISLRQVLTDYLETDLRPRTKEFYKNAVEGHLKDWLDFPLRDISVEMVERRCQDIGKRNGRAAANSAMRSLRALWNHNIGRIDGLPTNPVRRNRKWFAMPRRTRMVRFEDLPKFYAAVDGLESRVSADFVKTLLFTGLRRREAATLVWENVDFVGRVIRIPGIKTKSGEPLDLPMSTFVFDLLVARRSINQTRYVFEANSKTGHIEEPKFAFQLVAQACGVTVSCHDMRRTYATVCESADISGLALKALLNHALPGNDVTSGYIQMSVERLRGPAQKVCDLLLQLCNIGSVIEKNVVRIK